MTIQNPGVILVDWTDDTGKAVDRSPKDPADWPLIERCTRRDSRFVINARHQAQDLELSFNPDVGHEGRYFFSKDREHGRVERVDDLQSKEFQAFCPVALAPYAFQFRVTTAAEPSGSRRTWLIGLNLDSR